MPSKKEKEKKMFLDQAGIGGRRLEFALRVAKKKEKATAEAGLVIKNCFNKTQPCSLLVENPQPSWENTSNQLQRNIIC